MLDNQMKLAGFDDELFSAIQNEARRQEEHIELIASENYTSPRVLEAQGSILTNKYAEGYPGKRYYGGCEYVDVVETLAIERAKELFGAGFANVQPHSGSQANAAVYMALMKPGETFMGMSLADGGHLTHGASVSFSGRIYNAVQYGLNAESGEIDYDHVKELALQHKPKVIWAGFSAYSRVVDWQCMRDIADTVGAYFVVDMAHVAGLIAAGVYPSPVNIAHVTTSTTHKTLCGPRGGIILAQGDDEELNKRLNFSVFPESQGGPLMHVIAGKAACFKEAMSDEFVEYQKQTLSNSRTMAAIFMERGFQIVSGGTDDHLFLLSLVDKDVTGQDADKALGRANITVNKNAVPNDPRPPFVTSGIRIGSPAVTRRGFKKEEVAQLANWMCDILDDIDNEKLNASIKQQVLELCQRFPVYN
ncbi:MAG: serine hydroxymethyltransferase [Gammaproteobacteria bacterium]|jgi:glycine hydroxymethyltransferase|nr:serine hydroxymethyltransferase [Gammaproteobacteria bacterium]